GIVNSTTGCSPSDLGAGSALRASETRTIEKLNPHSRRKARCRLLFSKRKLPVVSIPSPACVEESEGNRQFSRRTALFVPAGRRRDRIKKCRKVCEAATLVPAGRA